MIRATRWRPRGSQITDIFNDHSIKPLLIVTIEAKVVTLDDHTTLLPNLGANLEAK
jgi:hypothetical protein